MYYLTCIVLCTGINLYLLYRTAKLLLEVNDTMACMSLRIKELSGLVEVLNKQFKPEIDKYNKKRLDLLKDSTDFVITGGNSAK